tara:strand:+ start:1444 stop:1638 length:195 start_codon:yes stop_codon:yes gene_type:complete
MNTPINFNKARKAKARTAKAQTAEENRARFGRTKAERTLEEARADKLAKLTDGHRLDKDPGEQG